MPDGPHDEPNDDVKAVCKRINAHVINRIYDECVVLDEDVYAKINRFQMGEDPRVSYWVLDPDCPPGQLFMLNANYIDWYVHEPIPRRRWWQIWSRLRRRS